MTMEALDRAKMHPKNQDPTRQFAIEQARHLLVSADIKDPGPKIEVGPKASVEAAPTIVQAPEPAFEIPTVSEALYMQTREALAREGYTFVVDIKSLSIGQLATDEATRGRFSYVNPSENMRAIAPPQMEVAINPKNVRIRNSNSKATDTQIEMIQREEAGLKGKLPQEVRDLISMRMQNASVLTQIDDKHQKETGKVLFTNWFGRTDDQTVPGVVANVGRLDPADRLDVDGWFRVVGHVDVFAFPVVVLPRKLVA